MAKIQCYMLRTEQRATHTAIVMDRHGMKSQCGDRPRHRAEFPVDETTTFAEARRRLPMKCMYCGVHEFTNVNADVAFVHTDIVYINPITHRVANNYREIATPGAMWFCPWLVEDGKYVSSILSVEYIHDWLGKRPPVCVKLPNGSEWIVDQKARGVADGSGWKVTGVPPLLTARPSIDAPGYHGWLDNGVLREVGDPP